jgi:hypothetical protein
VYTILIVWGDVVVVGNVDYDPTTNSVYDLEVRSLESVIIESDKELFIWPMNIDCALAWTLSNLPSPERIQMFPKFKILPNRPPTIRVVDTSVFFPHCYGILKDGTFVRVEWDSRRTRENLILTATDASPPASGSLNITVSAKERERLATDGVDAVIVVTAVFAETNDSASATVGLGKRSTIASETTLFEGLPEGTYFVAVLLMKNSVPVRAASAEWTTTIKIQEGKTTELTLPIE